MATIVPGLRPRTASSVNCNRATGLALNRPRPMYARSLSPVLRRSLGELQSCHGARAESTAPHVRILRCTLAVADSQTFWQHADLDLVLAARSRQAIEGRWFDVRSETPALFIAAFKGELVDSKPLDPGLANEFIDFFVRYAEWIHNKKAENHLFPLLEQRGLPRQGGPTPRQPHPRGLQGWQASSGGILDHDAGR
ncbi:MAG TPA: hypothetical protein VKP30_34080 [Polyangiaceae bacterium]|nr:hypothetical protein [Polyangiaceae bacterium]